MKVYSFKVRTGSGYKANSVFIGKLHAQGKFILGVAIFGYAIQLNF